MILVLFGIKKGILVSLCLSLLKKCATQSKMNVGLNNKNLYFSLNSVQTNSEHLPGDA